MNALDICTSCDITSSFRRSIRSATTPPTITPGRYRPPDDMLAFLREADGERMLVLVRRRDGEPVSLPGTGAREATTVYGGDPPSVTADGTLILPGEGPSFQILRLS